MRLKVERCEDRPGQGDEGFHGQERVEAERHTPQRVRRGETTLGPSLAAYIPLASIIPPVVRYGRALRHHPVEHLLGAFQVDPSVQYLFHEPAAAGAAE